MVPPIRISMSREVSATVHPSVKRIVHRPQPLLHQLKHVPALQLRVVLGDGLLDLGQEALAADATDALPMGLAPFSGSATGHARAGRDA